MRQHIFKNYILLFMTLLLSQLFSFAPLYPTLPPTPSGNPQTIVHAHGSCMYVIWLLYFLCCTLYPQDYFLTTDLYFLIPSPFHTFLWTPSIRQSSKHSLYLWFYFCSACLFYSLESIFDRYELCLLPFYCCIFGLLLKEDPLTHHIMLAWWWWTPLGFPYLGSSLSVIWF